jgi:hypothetical protein
MRFANFLSSEKEGAGLTGGGEKAREIYMKYRNTPKDELRKMVLNMLFDIARKD